MVACSGSEKLKMNVDQSTAGVSDYFELLKPRVMSLAIFTAIIGLLVTPNHVHPLLAVFSIIAIGAGAGAAGAINMWYDRDIDSIMDRTKSRPIPSGRVKSEEALTLGIVLSIFSIILLFVASNYIAAVFLFISIMFYTFIYTMWLKRYTPQNIVIGGAAGALPPVIGWYAVSQDFSLFPVILFMIIFLWTPPHFWALSLYRSEDYQKAGIPMLPVVKGKKITRLNIILYSLSLLIISPSLWYLGFLGNIYGIISSLLTIVFIYFSWNVYRKKVGSEPALFKYSILYLFLLFMVMPIDKYIYIWIS
ncbi:MAG: protoheme IX farnesyltransferase [Pelagibacterales bacterium]|nr:protoheme IX farnesyltransferase [Pelagibacterales bacterium]|tara:strand:- start:1518 stop:2435 length:918 start_codon:yes stop_codon:yes gene_type:complete